MAAKLCAPSDLQILHVVLSHESEESLLMLRHGNVEASTEGGGSNGTKWDDTGGLYLVYG